MATCLIPQNAVKRMKVGSGGPSIYANVRYLDEDGIVKDYDLSYLDISSIVFEVWGKLSGTKQKLHEWNAEASGPSQLRADISSLDTGTAGRYDGYFQITLAEGGPITIPSSGSIAIIIESK